MKLYNKLVFTLLMVSLSQGAFAATIIIANKATGLTTIDKQVKRAFLGKVKQWGNGVAVNACLEEAGDDAMADFYKSALGKSPSAYQAYWNRLLFSGKAAPPQTFSDRRELISFVVNNKGAICFTTSADSLPDNIVVLE